tara:strand:- start:114 stop:488 length:375 start_codon:yes stop_codon:yes gene_type:complete
MKKYRGLVEELLQERNLLESSREMHSDEELEAWDTDLTHRTCNHNLAITNFYLNLKDELDSVIMSSKIKVDHSLDEYETIEDRLEMSKDKAKYIAHHHATMRQAERTLEHLQEIWKQMLIKIER